MTVHLRRLRTMAMLAARSPEDAEGMAGVLWIATRSRRSAMPPPTSPAWSPPAWGSPTRSGPTSGTRTR